MGSAAWHDAVLAIIFLCLGNGEHLQRQADSNNQSSLFEQRAIGSRGSLDGKGRLMVVASHSLSCLSSFFFFSSSFSFSLFLFHLPPLPANGSLEASASTAEKSTNATKDIVITALLWLLPSEFELLLSSRHPFLPSSSTCASGHSPTYWRDLLENTILFHG